MGRAPPRSPLFPYTTLFRSVGVTDDVGGGLAVGRGGRGGELVGVSLAGYRIKLVSDAAYGMIQAIAESHHGENQQRADLRSEEHTSELQSHGNLVCRLLLEK